MHRHGPTRCGQPTLRVGGHVPSLETTTRAIHPRPGRDQSHGQTSVNVRVSGRRRAPPVALGHTPAGPCAVHLEHTCPPHTSSVPLRTCASRNYIHNSIHPCGLTREDREDPPSPLVALTSPHKAFRNLRISPNHPRKQSSPYPGPHWTPAGARQPKGVRVCNTANVHLCRVEGFSIVSL
ncbi:hypothetical protein EVAR_6943_1 [Eumeta japonica]|uniref:Uncharacterized protein n=1 Tax=Eumeta variegata TaxID=151549 RepID=A0A4C1THJ8_EUMVA|nr:hypothetical protein EVAR_6943_1 [Eumeta japonica]